MALDCRHMNEPSTFSCNPKMSRTSHDVTHCTIILRTAGSAERSEFADYAPAASASSEFQPEVVPNLTDFPRPSDARSGSVFTTARFRLFKEQVLGANSHLLDSQSRATGMSLTR